MINMEGLEEVEHAILNDPERVAAIIPRMLDAGAKVMIGAYQSGIKDYGVVKTGALLSSVGVHKSSGGLRPIITIGFRGDNNGRIRNMALAAINNYGIKKGRGRRAARSFIQQAQGSGGAVFNAMLAIWEADNPE